MSANRNAITAVLERPGLMLAEYPQGVLRAVYDWAPISGPTLSRECIVALLEDIAEAEVERWILWCIAQDRGKRRELPRLRAERGRVYAG
jgi:hypothetical protein